MSGSQASEFGTQTRKNMAKDKIIDYVAKFIRTKHYNSEHEAMSDTGYENMIWNLKEFLQYLEDKNIINPKQLEDEREINNLISDILKLDLTKFKGENGGIPGYSKKRSGSMNSHKDSKEIKQTNFHKRTGSEDVSKKKECMDKAKVSETPNSDPFKNKRRKSTTGEGKNTASVEHQYSNNSHRRANASLEEKIK